jgi:hypothetical protein
LPTVQASPDRGQRGLAKTSRVPSADWHRLDAGWEWKWIPSEQVSSECGPDDVATRHKGREQVSREVLAATTQGAKLAMKNQNPHR